MRRSASRSRITFLTEAFQFGLTDPGFNDPTSPDFIPQLRPFDLTRGGHLFTFNGHTDIKQEAVYAQDAMTLHNLTLSLGLRFDNYNGITHGNSLQPRVGISYLVKPTNTVFRISSIRTFETPYNENLILSNVTGGNGLADGILGDASAQQLKPGRRNQFNVGIQQGLGQHLVFDVDYFWKYTRNAYDFQCHLEHPGRFPPSRGVNQNSMASQHASTLAEYKGLTAYFTAGHNRARYFPPETGGLFFNSDLPAGVFRIDHDQAYQQTVLRAVPIPPFEISPLHRFLLALRQRTGRRISARFRDRAHLHARPAGADSDCFAAAPSPRRHKD